MDRIPVAGPWITDKEVSYAADAAANGWYERAGEYPRRFEEAMAAYVGSRYALSLPHCTAAIHLSLLALGVGPGDEVVVPDVTWIATAAPLSYVGATPVFADIDEHTWCLTPDSFEAVITPRTRAVIPVDLYGSMPQLDEIVGIARARDIAVVEDAAEAIGSAYRGRRAGSFGHTGVFSFHGSKTLVTGEGGMLVTNDRDLYDRVRFLSDHGRPPGDKYFLNSEIAYKYKMSSMQAAIGLAQIERVEELVARKREIHSWYREGLSDIEGLELNHEPEDVLNSFWMTTAVLDPDLGWMSRDLVTALDHYKIDSRPFFSPLSSLTPYRQQPEALAARERNTVSYRVGPRGINLPSALVLSRDNVAFVCESLREVLHSTP